MKPGDEVEKDLSIDDFFYKKEDHPALYEKAKNPVDQLSTKGLALNSAVYAEKTGNPNQPLIACSEDEFTHVTNLLANSAPGARVTVIIEAPNLHKSVVHLERTEQGINMVAMDSLPTRNYVNKYKICLFDVQDSYNETHAEAPIKTSIYFQNTLSKKDSRTGEITNDSGRQTDYYQCGVFATKDAHQMANDPDFFKKIQARSTSPNKSTSSQKNEIPDVQIFNYDLPPEYLKSAQNPDLTTSLAEKHADFSVSRGRTLKEIYHKHEEHGYVDHFSEKYKNNVTKFVSSHSAEEVKESTSKYEASKITQEEFNNRYGQKPVDNKIKNE